MFLNYFKGIWIGIIIAAPLGPIAILCIQKSLQKGRISGFLSGLGAASADLIYGVLAILGFSTIVLHYPQFTLALKIAGALFLIYLGINIFISRKKELNDKNLKIQDKKSLVKDYLQILILTITNPMTILMFLSVFSNLKIETKGFSSFLICIGIFTGSAIWWFMLAFFASLFSKKLGDKGMRLLNGLFGGLIAGFGIFSIIKVLLLIMISIQNKPS